MMVLAPPRLLIPDRYIVVVAVVADVAVAVAVVAVVADDVVVVLSQWQRNWAEALESVHLLASSWEHH